MRDMILYKAGFEQGYTGGPLYSPSHPDFKAGWEHGNEFREEEDTSLFHARETSGFNRDDDFFSPED